MAFTRAFLRGLSIDEDKIASIMEAHVEVTDALKRQRDDYKADADKYADAQKELDAIKSDGYKEKYDALKGEFDSYKAEREGADKKAKKSAAYREALKTAGVGEKYIDRVMKLADVDAIEFDKDGNVADADKLAASIKDEWGEFIAAKTEVGQDVKTPKKNTGGAMTRDQIMAITDRAERREAIRNNPDAFGRKE